MFTDPAPLKLDTPLPKNRPAPWPATPTCPCPTNPDTPAPWKPPDPTPEKIAVGAFLGLNGETWARGLNDEAGLYAV